MGTRPSVGTGFEDGAHTPDAGPPRRAGVAQGDAVEVEGGAELRQRVGVPGKEEAVAIHIELERQAVFGEGGGEEVEVSQEFFAMIDGGPGADA